MVGCMRRTKHRSAGTIITTRMRCHGRLPASAASLPPKELMIDDDIGRLGGGRVGAASSILWRQAPPSSAVCSSNDLPAVSPAVVNNKLWPTDLLKSRRLNPQGPRDCAGEWSHPVVWPGREPSSVHAVGQKTSLAASPRGLSTRTRVRLVTLIVQNIHGPPGNSRRSSPTDSRHQLFS